MQTILPTETDLKRKLFHKQTLLISDQQKYPELFRWKTGTLVMGALASILLIILVVVIYNIESENQIVTNLTFLSSIAQKSQIITNKQEIINLSQNFQQIYGTTKFQNAQLLYRTTELSDKIIREDIYSKQIQKLLYLVELSLIQTQATHLVRFAVFLNSPFPIPEDQDFNKKLTYYSFEIKQQRKSSLLSLKSRESLKLFASHPQLKSISECENYKFLPMNDERKGSFRLLNELIRFHFGKNDVQINSKGWKCFAPQLSDEQQMITKLKSIIHPSFNNPEAKLQLQHLQVYYLS